jgi:hypothetical protein
MKSEPPLEEPLEETWLMLNNRNDALDGLL